MGDDKQADRPLTVDTPLGTDKLLLRGISGREALSQLFRFELDLVALSSDDVAFEKLLGQKVTAHVALAKGDPRHFNGICARVSQGARDPREKMFTAYRIEIVPQLWLLTRKAQSRIFQHMSVPEILKKVFTGLNVSYDIQGTFEKRDYCVQYRETDFNFASRLMEEEGIYYYFKHTKSDHSMSVGNMPAGHVDLPGPSQLTYENLVGLKRDEDRVLEWEKVQELRSGKYTLWDHSFELPHQHLDADKLIQDSVTVGTVTHKLKVGNNEKLEIYDFPGEYAQRFDGIDKSGGEQPSELQKIFQDNKRTVDIRMQEEASPSIRIRGSSNVRQMVAGHKFTLQKHFNADGGPYVLTDVSIRTSGAGDFRAGETGAFQYSNEFTCIPQILPFRPPRTTPKPVVPGTQTAVVVGPKGEEIFTDKYGRVKVQFHWDREGKNDPDSSCWIRVGSHWAGKQWGIVHIPRVGQEVIVDFLEGDPDQPIIVGSVYNADMMPPYKLPDHRTQSGVKSRSSLGGGPENFNEIRFEDKKGHEEIHVQAERNLTTTVEASESRSVGGSRSTTIQKDETLVIKDGNRKETLEKGNDSLTVAKGSRDCTISEGNDTLTVSKGGITISAPNGQYHVSAKTVLVEATDKIEIKCGASVITLVPASITIKSTQIEVAATALVSIKGATAKLHGDASVDVDSTGPVTVKGNPIKLNC